MRRRLFPVDAYPDGHPDLALSLHYLGAIELKEGGLDDAFRHLVAALRTFRVFSKRDYSFGTDDVDRRESYLSGYHMSLRDLARLHLFRGEVSTALDLYNQRKDVLEQYPIAEIREKYLIENCQQLADTLLAGGYLAQARKELLIALDLLRDGVYAGHDSDLMNCLYTLGFMECRAGDYLAASRYAEQSLSIAWDLDIEDDFPSGTRVLAIYLNQFGTVLAGLGRYERAREYIGKGLALRRHVLNETHHPQDRLRLARSLIASANLLLVQAEYFASQRYFKQAVELLRDLVPKDSFPNGHFELAVSLQNLAIVQETCGNLGDAIRSHREATEMFEVLAATETAMDRRPLAVGLSQLGNCYRQTGELGRADEVLAKALDLYREALGPERWADGNRNVASVR